MNSSSKLANFKARARVIDLLGREQIADAPTAIGEIFKNAIDAAATEVHVDYWDEEPSQKLLCIEDNGLGMRESDLLDKWLVLATESKREKTTDKSWLKHASSAQRRRIENGKTFGEKGIGRLSMAVLGRGVLVWTRWGNPSSPQGTLALVHWHLFRHPKLVFNDLPIPYRRIKGIPDISDVEELVSDLSNALISEGVLKGSGWDPEVIGELKADLREGIQDSLSQASFSNGPGTMFAIFGASQFVDELFQNLGQDFDQNFEDKSDSDQAYPTFAAFNNPFDGKSSKLGITVARNGKPLEKLSNFEFWKLEDFDRADHHIDIRIQANGFAQGIIRDRDVEYDYQIQLPQLPPRANLPGPFRIKFGYIQGDKRFSPLNTDDWHSYKKRLDAIGGLLVYMDGIRIQPYGHVEQDFLSIENRRTKNAGRYYFSHRRMFGAVFLDSQKNPMLFEKAGREGFQSNSEFRGLKALLISLLIDLADTYFGTKAEREDKAEEKARREAEKERKKLEVSRDIYLEDIAKANKSLAQFEDDAKDEIREARRRFSEAKSSFPALHIDECEEALSRLESFVDSVGECLPGSPNPEWSIRGENRRMVQQFETKKRQITRLVERESGKLQGEYQSLAVEAKGIDDRLLELQKRVQKEEQAIDKKLRGEVEPLIESLSTLGTRIEKRLNDERSKLTSSYEAIIEGVTLEDIARDKSGKLARKLEAAFTARRHALDEAVPSLGRSAQQVLDAFSGEGALFRTAALGADLERLEERLEYLAEAAQLGLIVESADHEYESHVRGIKSAIRRLGKSCPGGKDALIELESSFEIVDERIRLFDPLVRKGTRVSRKLPSEAVLDYLSNRFPEERTGVEISASPKFKEKEWTQIRRPVLLGAVHNVVANAIYWAAQGVDKPRVRLSVARKGFVISDSGPGVAEPDRERIFEPGISRRPNGRGLGLFIAQEALKGFDYQIELLESPARGALSGANFLFTPTP